MHYLNVFRKAPNVNVNLASVSTPNILNVNNTFNSFWISWIHGVIQVGIGTVLGNGIFMSYNDTSPSAVNYIALSGWGTAGSAFFNDGL